MLKNTISSTSEIGSETLSSAPSGTGAKVLSVGASAPEVDPATETTETDLIPKHAHCDAQGRRRTGTESIA